MQTSAMDDYEWELEHERSTGALDLEVAPAKALASVQFSDHQQRAALGALAGAAVGLGVAAALPFLGLPIGLLGGLLAGAAGAMRPDAVRGSASHMLTLVSLLAKRRKEGPDVEALWNEAVGLSGSTLTGEAHFKVRAWKSLAKQEGPLDESDDYGPFWAGLIPHIEGTVRGLLWHEDDELFEAVLEHAKRRDRRFLEEGRERGMTLSRLRVWAKVLEACMAESDEDVTLYLSRRIGVPAQVIRGKSLSTQLQELLEIRNPLAHGREFEIGAEHSAGLMQGLVGTQRFTEWWEQGTTKKRPWVRLVAGRRLVLAARDAAKSS